MHIVKLSRRQLTLGTLFVQSENAAPYPKKVNFISICAFCDSSLWLEKWLGFSVSWWSPNIIVCGAFAVKPI